LSGLFEQVLKVCQASGLVKLGHVALDGTKIKANASKHKAMSYGRMVEKEKALRKEIQTILRRAEAADTEDDRLHGSDHQGEELPAELACRETRLKKIREAKAALEAEAREEAEANGKDPETAKPPTSAQRSFTDPESRIQKTPDGFIQGHNAQVAVDDLFQSIVAQHVTSASPDVQQLQPSVASIERTLECRPQAIVADAGYFSEANLRALEKKKIEPFINPQKEKHSGPTVSSPRGRPPGNLTLRQRMARKLRTAYGRKTYSRRKVVVEPVLGQIKQARGFRQFLRRGLRRVGHEWALVCTAHNLLKLRTALAMI